MAQLMENIHPTVVVKALHYLLETSDMYQYRDMHIDNTWLQQIHISNSENRMYLHNAHGTECSVNGTNIQKEI